MLRSSWRSPAGTASTSASADCATADVTPPLARYASMVSVRPSRRSQVARSACESRGRAPGSPATSPSTTSTSPGSSRSPARRAGSVTARRSSSSLIAPSRIWFEATARRELGMRAQLAVEVGPHADRHRSGVREQRVDEALARCRVVAERVQLLELVDDDERRGVAVDRRRRLRPGVQQPRARTPGTSPAPTDAIRPARSSEDFPLPDAPTSASRRRGASRSTTEPSTSSRPKKNSRSSASNASSPR